MKFIIIFLALLLAALPVTVFALEAQLPFLYSRDTVTIMRRTVPQSASLPWQPPPAVEDPAITFDVDLRNVMTLYNQKGWFNMDSPLERNGVLLVFDEPGIAPISRSAQYAPLDILMIDKEGTIIQIVPNIKLSELGQDIMPDKPVLAFLFVRGGTCKSLSINPGDMVRHRLFKKPPPVLSESAPPQNATTPAAPAVPAAPVTSAAPPAANAPLQPVVLQPAAQPLVLQPAEQPILIGNTVKQ